jgi:hypothetical protein
VKKYVVMCELEYDGLRAEHYDDFNHAKAEFLRLVALKSNEVTDIIAVYLFERVMQFERQDEVLARVMESVDQ